MLDALTLDQMRVFVAVAEVGSFSAASRRLMRVQSAISHAVQALETTLGVALFDRRGRLPVLTEAGVALLIDARALLRGADALRAKASSFNMGVEPELAIAVDPLFPKEVLFDGLRHVEAEFPAMTIRLITDVIGRPERHLRDQTVSLAIYSLETTKAKDLVTQFLIQIDMIPVIASHHPAVRSGGTVNAHDLADITQLV